MYVKPIIQKFPHELEFISQINRDGKGVSEVSQSFLKACETNSLMKNELYDLYCLSVTEGTFIAQNFNSYVVKIKPQIDVRT